METDRIFQKRSPLTISKTLEETRRIWEWTAENPSALWAPGSSRYISFCPCCSYVVQQVNKSKKIPISYPTKSQCLEFCPMKSVWRGGHCKDPKSPYSRYQNIGLTIVGGRQKWSYDIQFMASVIAEGAGALSTEREDP